MLKFITKQSSVVLIKSVIILYQLGLVSLPFSYALNNVIIHPPVPPL